MFDYFYGAQAEQFAFYRVPKVLFTNDRFKYLSAEAKTLYGILLDCVPLSAKNGWIDEQGRVYIICTIEEIMADMNCGNKKAIQLLSDLEDKVGLIERKRQGLGKPNLIYVKNFISVDSPVERHSPCSFRYKAMARFDVPFRNKEKISLLGRRTKSGSPGSKPWAPITRKKPLPPELPEVPGHPDSVAGRSACSLTFRTTSRPSRAPDTSGGRPLKI